MLSSLTCFYISHYCCGYFLKATCNKRFQERILVCMCRSWGHYGRKLCLCLIPPKGASPNTDGLSERGPTTFDLPAILQKRYNLRETSNKMIYETTDSQDLKLKKENKWVRHCNHYTAPNSNLLHCNLLQCNITIYYCHTRTGLPNIEYTFNTKSFSLGNRSLLASFQKLSTV